MVEPTPQKTICMNVLIARRWLLTDNKTPSYRRTLAHTHKNMHTQTHRDLFSKYAHSLCTTIDRNNCTTTSRHDSRNRTQHLHATRNAIATDDIYDATCVDVLCESQRQLRQHRRPKACEYALQSGVRAAEGVLYPELHPTYDVDIGQHISCTHTHTHTHTMDPEHRVPNPREPNNA